MEFTNDWFCINTPMWASKIHPLLPCGPLRLMEIGSYEGRSAVWMAEHWLHHPKSKLICVDVWSQHAPEHVTDWDMVYQRFQSNIKATGRYDQIQVIRLPSHKVFNELALPLDFIYIDGSHNAADVMYDALAAMHVINLGGIIAFDDYTWTGNVHMPPGPAIDFFLKLCEDRIKVIEAGRQVVIQRIK